MTIIYNWNICIFVFLLFSDLHMLYGIDFKIPVSLKYYLP